MADDELHEPHSSELDPEGPRARGPRRRRPHPHRPRSRSASRRLTPEERAYREARRVANAKISFLIHLVAYASVCLFLLLVAGFRPAFIVALSWGIGLALHYFTVVIAPGLRRRLIDEEVARRVTTTVSHERQELRGEHSRNLEELSASIAHEIRNPITAAKSLVQQMGEDPAARDNIEYAQVALEELDRVERSISHLLRFAREEDLRLREIRIAEVVESALDTFRDRIAQHEVRVDRQIDAAGQMRGDPEKLRRVIINLFNNALDALEEAGVPDPSIQLAAGENLAGTEVWLRVRDNGPGIDAEKLHKIFSPFYTSKSEGTGLGLAISKKVVDAHGGSIEATSTPGAGTEFLLTFPKHQAAGADA